MKKKYEMDMCNGSISKKMILFALPLMCSGILQLLFNAADIVVVGRFAGDNSLAAVGSTTTLIHLLTNGFIGLSVGANVLAAQCYGGNRDKDLKETVHTSMTLSIYSGIFLTLVGVALARVLLELMQSPDDVINLAVLYLRIYFLGMTSTMIYNFGSALLRAVGDTRRPLYYLLSAGVINVILNLFFVIVLKMDVAGVATATALSQTISALLVVRCLIRETGAIHLDLKSLCIKKDKLFRIIQVGLPAGFQGMLFSLSNVVVQSAINSFGAIAVAGNSAAANIESFVYTAMNAFYQATISFTSQNYGAKKYKRIYKILFIGELYVTLTGTILGKLGVHYGRTLLGIYSSSPEVIDAGMERLRLICSYYAFCGMMDVLVGSLRGVGCSVVPMITSLIGACGLRLLWIATVFQIPEYHSLRTVFLSYPISWIVTMLVHIVTFIIISRKLLNKNI
jgi:putative MATE family efflux protein